MKLICYVIKWKSNWKIINFSLINSYRLFLVKIFQYKSIPFIEKDSINRSKERNQHHHNRSNNPKHSCCTPILTKMLSHHNKPICIGKISNRPYKKPHKCNYTQDIKDNRWPLTTKHNLIGQYKQVHRNRQPYNKDKDTDSYPYTSHLDSIFI